MLPLVHKFHRRKIGIDGLVTDLACGICVGENHFYTPPHTSNS